MGESGAGAAITLVNTLLSGTMNAALSEAMSVALAAGLDPDAVSGGLRSPRAPCGRAARASRARGSW
jgi:3-hydroxyisobutyrate dehydrogenase-like beta-hydroxyacid dehydrogenase